MMDNEIFENESVLELTEEEMELVAGGRSATLRVKRGSLNVYSEPSKSSRVLMSVDRDDTLYCTGEATKNGGKTWIRVRVNGCTGWVRGDKVK